MSGAEFIKVNDLSENGKGLQLKPNEGRSHNVTCGEGLKP